MDHVGGTIRATLNTASTLADLGHEVEIVNVFRYRGTPHFTPDPRVGIRHLVDRTARSPWTLTGVADRLRSRRGSRVYPAGDTRAGEFNRLTDKRVAEFLGDCGSDVIVGTRPGLNVYVARFSPRSAVTVAQEHLFYDHHKPRLRDAMSREYSSLDAMVTVSEADANNYRRHMPHLASRIRFIPNSIQPTPLPPSVVDSKVIVAAGRIARPKRFDMLLRIFARVHRRHPDWSLRIYGTGRHLKAIRDLVTDLDLGDAVSLMGQVTPLDAEWVKGSIAVVTSKYESFGLTLVEAMDCGLPVVSTACDYGPPEIVDHEVDGLLSPVKDEDAVTENLCRLIEDDSLRKRMSANALRKARKYFPSEIGARYEALFHSLVSQKHRTPPRGARIPDRTPPRGARIPVGVGGGGGALPEPPTPPPGIEPPDDTVNCLARSFDDLTLTARRGARGRFTLESGTHAPIAVPEGTDIRLDSAFCGRLPEGWWRLFRDGEPVEAGRVDSRALLRRPGFLPRSVVVPCSDDGQLALRVWRRETYAELRTVRWEQGRLQVDGDMLGPLWDKMEVQVLAKLRHKGRAHHWPAAIDASGAFSCTIEVDDLAATRVGSADLWDLWLADVAGEHAPVRLARFFDDITNRKKTQLYAHKMVNDRLGRHRVHPYYNIDNELSIKVEESD
ncbi:glycosyltransferase [Stackebrandtia nassauensis]|uniref:glycosyltransferase n=1 Tax=Stackebrandtia nassauensis TaxID=283811 RepID=UPI001FCAFDB7|nr:glycosyltransferase [Stackebrandtia nassauensis]